MSSVVPNAGRCIIAGGLCPLGAQHADASTIGRDAMGTGVLGADGSGKACVAGCKVDAGVSRG